MKKNEPADLKSLLNKLRLQFNKLPESAINPLMTGIFLLGMAATFFEPAVVAYLTMIFGASSGIAYAATKNQTVHQLPTWAFPTFGVAAALIYAFAGIPGMVLTAGLSGGWYIHSYYSDKFQQWKTDFHQFVENFKTNPVNQSVHVTFLALQMLSNFIIKMEEPAPEESEQYEKELFIEEMPEDTAENPLEEKIIADGSEQIPEPVTFDKTIEQTAEKLEQAQKQVQEQQTQEQPIMPTLEQTEEPQQQPTQAKRKSERKAKNVVPAPVLFSKTASQQTTNAATVTKPKTTTPNKVIIPPKKDSFSVVGQELFAFNRRPVRVDNSWIGIGRALLYSLDPRVDLVNDQGQNISQMASKRNQVRL